MSVENDGTYDYLSITLTGIDLNVGMVLYYLEFEASSSFDWSHEIENLSFDISKYDENACTYILDVVSGHDDLSGWLEPEEEEGESGGDDESITVTTYICVVDSTGSGWVTNGTFHNSDNIFVNNNDSYHNWDSSTWIQAYVGNSTRNAYYQTSTLELESGKTYWITFQGAYSSQEYYFEITVPSDCGETATFVIYADLSAFDEWEENKTSVTSFSTEITGGTWYSGAVSDVVGYEGQLK